MVIDTKKLKELLVTPGHIAEEDFAIAEKEAKKQKKDTTEILVEKDLIKDEQLGQVIAEALGIPFINLRNEKIDEDVLRLIPEVVAKTQGVYAFGRSEEGVKVGMTDPSNLEVRHAIEKRIGENVVPYYITHGDLRDALARYQSDLSSEFQELLNTLSDATLPREERDEATVGMVDILLRYGYQSKASDVHIEPYTKKTVVRFRIDGVMHDVLEIPKEYSRLMLTRIKILSRMRTDEHRAAQDGKLTFTSDEEKVDVRVSVVPVTEGENIVMRLLSAKSRQFSLSDLGLRNEDLQKVNRAIKHPHGMILVTGPTGSGKTTTLYAVLKLLNKRELHISTIEDPVEYDIEGISQIQVNIKTNLTFAKGLRAIVRQDPDIIMIGEVRDEETASIAVNSALTGHLVLSTLHTNDAATTLPRLLDMGIEPFLVASTINVAVAQRLVRKICDKCRVSYILSEDEKNLIKNDPYLQSLLVGKNKKSMSKVRLFKGEGCAVCAHTGYTGRIGIFEVLEITESVKELIINRATSDKLTEAARSEGMSVMLEDGIKKVLQGVTTLEEVMRVTRE